MFRRKKVPLFQGNTAVPKPGWASAVERKNRKARWPRQSGSPQSQPDLRLDMNKEQIQSAAFKEAELRSERLRIFGILGFFALLVLVTMLRVFVFRTARKTRSWPWTFVLAAVVIAYELCMLYLVDRALKARSGLAPKFWVLGVVLETSIPAFAVAFLASSQLEVSYRPVANPSILVFFVFIILSTLRLSPWISILSGMVASCSYICAALYLGWRPPVPGVSAPITQSGVSLNAVTLLI